MCWMLQLSLDLYWFSVYNSDKEDKRTQDGTQNSSINLYNLKTNMNVNFKKHSLEFWQWCFDKMMNG